MSEKRKEIIPVCSARHVRFATRQVPWVALSLRNAADQDEGAKRCFAEGSEDE